MLEHAEGFGFGCCDVLGGGVAVGRHSIEHYVASIHHRVGVGVGIQVGRGLHNACEHGRLRKAELWCTFAKVGAGCGLDAEGTVAEVDEVEVAGEDVVFA
ncbi:hypothetical protein CIP100275_00333 [Corynebacterium diphtheriae]|nr:hypothetical protein CIP100275_00333 [Corynebacterium diphtheriae]